MTYTAYRSVLLLVKAKQGQPAMQRLPWVPTHVDFAHVRKATANFHGSMKLGKGGFSSVYRCKLPVPAADCASASTRTGNMIEVAVKKFTREVDEQRYEDFLAEVSIINRLCHKNIVPLVGKHLLTMDLWPFISINLTCYYYFFIS